MNKNKSKKQNFNKKKFNKKKTNKKTYNNKHKILKKKDVVVDFNANFL